MNVRFNRRSPAGTIGPVIAVTLATGLSGPVEPVRAQDVTNIATATFTGTDGRPTAVQSNPVRFTVRRPDQSAIRIFRFTEQGAGGETMPIAAPICRGDDGNRQIVPAGAFSDLDLDAPALLEGSAIREGEPVAFGVSAAYRNVDPAAVDRFDLTITTDAGDVETIEVVETAPDSGVFTAFFPTSPFPDTPVSGDCVLTVKGGTSLSASAADGPSPVGDVALPVLVDPFGDAFDSVTGQLVRGTRITIVEAATGQPATVYGDDGVSRFPSTVTVGTTVTDAAGNSYVFPEGFYRFPFVAAGDYRLIVEPPPGHDFPSSADPAALAALPRPGGGTYQLSDGSYGRSFTLTGPEPVRIDIPLDPQDSILSISKVSSRATAQPGEAVGYLIEFTNRNGFPTGPVVVRDILPDAMRLRPDSVRLDGREVDVEPAGDGRAFSITVPELAAGGRYRLNYIAEVRSDARIGQAVNMATIGLADAAEPVARADASVRIERDGISERMTLVGRVTLGGCGIHPDAAKGIEGVRVMLENGIQTVTDSDGRYHFEGLKSGTHVVQIDPDTLPADQRPIDCAGDSRSAGSAISRFVTGLKGDLKRADFRTISGSSSNRTAVRPWVRPTAEEDGTAAGAALGAAQAAAKVEWLFPEPDHNPRAKAVRVAISHLPGQTIRLSANGKPVDRLAYDGTQKSADGAGAISLWRGIPLAEGNTKLVAEVVGPDGQTVMMLDRVVHYAGAPMRAQLDRKASRLIADGVSRPVIAVRLTDGSGRPIQHGAVGEFSVAAPYRPAVALDAQQAEQLAGLEQARPVWRVIGDDGLAYIELEPTAASGSIAIGFTFRDGKVVRQQSIEAWLEPGDRPWTVIGLAEGTAGFAALNGALEGIDSDGDDSDIDLDGRVALYAKGRVTGKWLLTLAYDSDKEEDEERFGGIIDPTAYYTIYADRSEQRYDAASVRKLYVKLERPQFYALFGDYATGIDEPVLARYQRAFNGLKAEYRSPQVHAVAFGADTPNRFRRVELQGNGLTGPYDLGSRTIVPNSEQIVIEVRDRFRSDRIAESRQLARHIDYDIDYSRGSVRFRQPVLSRSAALDPQFVVVNFEVDGIGERMVNAGGRVSWNDRDDRLRIGATLIRDEDERGVSDVGGVDARLRIADATEVRAEIALSDHRGSNGAADNGAGHAWLVEAEHHDERFDVLAYARRQTGDFGVGQLNRAESGTTKYGADGRVRLTDTLEANLSGWQEIFDDSDARRRAAAGEIAWRSDGTRIGAGLVHAEDRLDDGGIRRSTLARLSGSQKLLNDRLELGIASEVALGGQDESADFPARHRLSARWALRPDVALVGAYEIADGEAVEARTARVGVELAPWAGARLLASANRQDIGEYGARSYAAYGLNQSFRIDERLSVDLSVDGNRTIGSTDDAAILNPDQPLASGGHLGAQGQLTEDFLAATAGATYRGDVWSLVGRAEWRDGEDVDRYGATLGAIRQIGEGRAIGGLAQWTRAEGEDGARTEVASIEAAIALRPANSRWSLLDKIELRHDSVRGAVTGAEAPLGGALFLTGDATSRRAINHLALNYTPIRVLDDRNGNRRFTEAGEYSLYWGTRYVSEAFGDADVSGWSNIVAADMRFNLSEKLDIGGSASVRVGTGARTVDYSVGPTLTVVPFDNANLSIGYNFSGYRDRDFEDARTTREGVYLTFRLKFDQTSFAGLGL